MSDTGVSAEMPRYKCHKEVWALRIAGLREDGDGGGTITPAEPGYAPVKVPREYMLKHKPQIGGYYVVYRDGYKSWSPASEFEDGYSRIE